MLQLSKSLSAVFAPGCQETIGNEAWVQTGWLWVVWSTKEQPLHSSGEKMEGPEEWENKIRQKGWNTGLQKKKRQEQLHIPKIPKFLLFSSYYFQEMNLNVGIWHFPRYYQITVVNISSLCSLARMFFHRSLEANIELIGSWWLRLVTVYWTELSATMPRCLPECQDILDQVNPENAYQKIKMSATLYAPVPSYITAMWGANTDRC